MQTVRVQTEGGAAGQDVTALALNEGILDPGRKVSGFLFFERPEREGNYKVHWEVWSQIGDIPLTVMDLVFERRIGSGRQGR